MAAEMATARKAQEEMYEGCGCAVSEEDLEAIRKDLGFVPNNLMHVAAYFTSCEQLQKDLLLPATHKTNNTTRRPAVLALYPLRNAEDAYKVKQRSKVEPFPTLFWLCSSELKAKVSLLEDQGMVQHFQDRLDAHQPLRDQMHASHVEYAQQRWSMLTAKDQELVLQRNWTRALRDVGIGGIRNFASVKCLHTHYAHFLATGHNLIGEWVQEALQTDFDRASTRKRQ